MSKSSKELRFNLEELSQQVGLSTTRLRVWELRYGILPIEREFSDDGKVYVSADVDRIRGLISALDANQNEVVTLQHRLVVNKTSVTDIYPLLLEAFSNYDEPSAQTLLDAGADDLTHEIFFEEVLLPVLNEIGARWEAGTLSVGLEHFASNIIRGKLLDLARRWGDGEGPMAILACAPGEIHEFPLMMLGILLHQHGWSIRYLGMNTPIAAILETVEFSEPDVILIAARLPEMFEAVIPQLRALSHKSNLILAGRGASKEIADQMKASLVKGGPRAATAEILNLIHRDQR